MIDMLYIHILLKDALFIFQLFTAMTYHSRKDKKTFRIDALQTVITIVATVIVRRMYENSDSKR